MELPAGHAKAACCAAMDLKLRAYLTQHAMRIGHNPSHRIILKKFLLQIVQKQGLSTVCQ
jgi:hypothetical protein